MDFPLVKEFFRETSLDIAAFIFVVGIFYVMVSLLRAMILELKIENIETKKQKEIENIREQTIPNPIIEGQIKVMIAKYEPTLNQLNRRRKFILERLPFFKN